VTPQPEANRVPLWRVLAALFIVGGMLFFLALFTPYYMRNLKLQTFVSETARHVEVQTQSDDWLKQMVLAKAHQLNLPVEEDNVHITRSQSGVHIDVRYFVNVSFPGYTVRLHFYPGAGSR
jgi:hypothetical protein